MKKVDPPGITEAQESLALFFVQILFRPQIERDLISERTKQGLAAARAKGKILGRPKGPGKSKLDQFKPEIEALLKNGSSKTFIAKRYKTSAPNFYKWLKKHGIPLKAENQ